MTGRTTRQFRVLYRDFLFGIVDRELLSTHAKAARASSCHQVITGPLAMTDTVAELSPEQQRRFLQGYGDDRRPASDSSKPDRSTLLW